jgi:hypothetical protein
MSGLLSAGDFAANCFFLSGRGLPPQLMGTMTYDEMREIAERLPLNAPDMRHDDSSRAAALTSHCGKLLTATQRLRQVSDDSTAKDQAMKHCGAAILILVSIIGSLELDPDETVRAGERELH